MTQPQTPQITELEIREAELQMTGRPPVGATGFIGFVPNVPSAPPAPAAASTPGAPPSDSSQGNV
jgi:hypothetical protein